MPHEPREKINSRPWLAAGLILPLLLLGGVSFLQPHSLRFWQLYYGLGFAVLTFVWIATLARHTRFGIPALLRMLSFFGASAAAIALLATQRPPFPFDIAAAAFMGISATIVAARFAPEKWRQAWLGPASN